jgi:hypothetical protein
LRQNEKLEHLESQDKVNIRYSDEARGAEFLGNFAVDS